MASVVGIEASSLRFRKGRSFQEKEICARTDLGPLWGPRVRLYLVEEA